MTPLIKSLVFATLFFAVKPAKAQDNDYLKHGKIFYYCSFKKVCSGCNSCENTRYKIKIKNNLNKKIKSIHYKIYSSVYDRIETKEAKIEGDNIGGLQTSIIYICVSDIKHWNISEITYDDDTSATFAVHGGLESFIQEPDECDCN